MLTAVLLFLVVLRPTIPLPSRITLGGIFDDSEVEQQIVFQIAADWINENWNILERSTLFVEKITDTPNNTFQLSRKVCDLLTLGVAGIFGPQSTISASHVQSICDALEVPHIETRWDYKLSRVDLSINLHPDVEDLTMDYIRLVWYFNWTNFILVYEENEGLIRLQDFLKESTKYRWNIQLYQFPPGIPYRELFRDIRISFKKKPRDDICILLDVSANHLNEVFKEAQRVEMMTVRNKYIVTSLDLHTLDLDDFRYSRANITGFRLIRTKGNEKLSGNRAYEKLLRETNIRLRRHREKQITALSTTSALLFDGVNLFSRALQELDNGKHVNEFPKLHCDFGTRGGTDGTSLINYMKSLQQFYGLTGNVDFDSNGFRSGFMLDILQLTREGGLEKIGTISSYVNYDINITEKITLEDPPTGLENRKYIITTIQQNPFVMLKNSPRQLSGNEKYEGYIVDFIQHLSEQLHFTYEIREVKDGAHGIDVNGVWSGMIGEVIRGEADMAIADISVTAAREKVVDFTLPFMTTGISILYKKPTEKVTSLFSFLSPFSADVWIYAMAVYLAVSFVLFIVGRLSPYEWENPHPCRQDSEIEENCFTFGNSMWFLIASFMQEGSEIEPRALSTRTIAGSWYFFTLIMISSYTAKMAAFLTVEKVMYPISSVNELSRQSKIKYGCTKAGSTRTFFQNSTIDIYKNMWEVMYRNKDDVLMENNEKGKEHVLMGNYAFLMESASIQYHTERECNLTQIGGLLDNKGYSIAVKKGNASLGSWLSNGILYLQEEGILSVLHERWWKQKRGGGSCTERPSSKAKELELSNVGGVFVVLLAGVLLGSAMACLEFLWKFQKYASSKEDLGKMMAKEIKFALACSSSTKEVPRPQKRLGKSQSTMLDSTQSRTGIYRQ